MSNTQRAKLAPDVVKRLRTLADSSDPKAQTRARIILRTYDGISPAELAQEVGMSQSGVRYWLREFRSRGVAALEGNPVEPEGMAPEPTPAPLIIEAIIEPIIEAVETPPEAPKNKRGRPRKAVAEPAPVMIEPEPMPAPVTQPELIPSAVIEAEPEKPRRGRKPKAAPVVEAIALPEAEPPAPEPVIPEPVQAALELEKPKRGRGRKPAAGTQPAPIPDPIPEPPEPIIEAVIIAEPERPRRGRPRKIAAPVIELPVIPAEPPPPPAPPPITTVRGLVDKYGVNLTHAQYVTDLAYKLFDATAEVHRLPDHLRRLLQAGALLHGIADQIAFEDHHERARDIILATPLERFTLPERTMIALLAAFHRKKAHPEREPAFVGLSETMQADTLALAAILRIADGLDGSQTQTTQIAEVSYGGRELLILLTGDNAVVDAQRAKSKADLWLTRFGQHAIIEPMPEQGLDFPDIPILTAPPLMRDQMPDLVLSLDPSMSAARAVRKLALHYAGRLDRIAAQARAGDERRLEALEREAERLIGLLTLTQAEHNTDSLVRLRTSAADALTAYELYDRALQIADDQEDALAPLVAARADSWRDSAHEKLREIDFEQLSYALDNLRREMVSDPNVDNGALIGTLIAPVVWAQLAELRDVVERGESVSDALVAARRLQDYLLYFRSLLGAEAVQALDMLTPFEGFLTAIHTAQAILGILGVDSASSVLRKAQEVVLNELADGLPSVWGSVNSATFRRAVALALAAP